MASQYSILRDYGKYVSPYNIDLMAKGMEYMQGKIDTNRQAINEYADYIINQDIIKPQDREYLQGKLNGIIQDINDVYRKSNLSSDGVARSIQSRLGEALDTRVMNAISGTREYRQFSEKIEDMKLNNPKQYSAINEWDALRPFYQWYEDGQVGSRMNPLHYTPYTDYNAEIDGKVKDFIAKYKGQKIQEPVVDEKGNRTGEIIETTVDEMPYSRIRSIVAASISQNARAQMQIEGRYMAATNPGMFDQRSTQSFIQRYVSDFDTQERALKAELAGVGNDSRRRKMLENSLVELRDQRQQMMDEANSFIGQRYDPERAGMFVVQQEFLRGAAMRWSYNNTSVLRKADEYYYKESDRLMKNAEFMWKKQVGQERLKYEKMRAEATMMKAMGGSGSDTGGGGVAGQPGTSYTVPSPLDEVKPSGELMTSISNNKVAVSNQIQKLKNSMNPNDVANIMAGIQADPKTYGSLNENDAFAAYIDNNGGATNAYLGTRDSQSNYSKLIDLLNQRKSNQNIYDMAEAGRKTILDQGLDAAISAELTNNPGLDIFLDNNETVNAGDLRYLESVKIGGVSLDTLSAAKVSSLMARLSDTITYSGGGGIHQLGVTREVGDVVKAESLLKDINSILGSDFTVQDLNDILKVGINANVSDFTPKLSSLFDDEKKYLASVAMARNIAKETGGVAGHKWSRSPYVNKLMRDADGEFDRIVADHRNEFAQKSWIFRPDDMSKDGKTIYQKLESLVTRSGGVLPNNKDVDNKHTLSPERDKDGNWWIVVDSGKDDKQRIAVTEQDLVTAGYTSYVKDRNIPAETYESKVSKVSFAPASAQAYGRTLDNLHYGAYATVDNAKEYLNNLVISGYPEAVKPEYAAAMAKILDNASMYEVKAKGFKYDDGSAGIDIYIYKAGTGNDQDMSPLMAYEIQDAFADETARIMGIAPQVFLAEGVRRAFEKDVRAVNSMSYFKGTNEDLKNLLEVVMNVKTTIVDGSQQQQQ